MKDTPARCSASPVARTETPVLETEGHVNHTSLVHHWFITRLKVQRRRRRKRRRREGGGEEEEEQTRRGDKRWRRGQEIGGALPPVRLSRTPPFSRYLRNCSLFESEAFQHQEIKGEKNTTPRGAVRASSGLQLVPKSQ